MTKINTYEGNSFKVERDFVTDTTLSAYTVTFTLKQNKGDTTAIQAVTGTVVADGVTFLIPSDDTLSKGTYYFEITGETSSQKVTFEQDRVIVRESIVYVT